jgi:hypothetical protein
MIMTVIVKHLQFYLKAVRPLLERSARFHSVLSPQHSVLSPVLCSLSVALLFPLALCLPREIRCKRPFHWGSLRRVSLLIFSLAPLALCLVPHNVYAASVTLAWDANSESDLGGYKIHYGTASKNYQYSVDVGKSTGCTISNLQEAKTYYFAATAYDTGNNESDFSAELAYTIPVLDTDKDGISDDNEINVYHTDPDQKDTDGDGINDGDELNFWGDNWNADDDEDGVINLLDQDSDEDGSSDGREIIGGSDPAQPDSNSGSGQTPATPDAARPEVGQVQLDHNWIRVSFKESFIDPIVVAGSFSINGSDPGVIRIRNVNSSGFEIHIQEWDYLDLEHTKETAGYLVMERGHHDLADGTQVEAGRFETDKTGSFGQINFKQAFQKKPVVTTSVAGINEADAVTGRMKNISPTGFEFCLQEQELNPKSHLTETINYIAWEPSSGNVGDLQFDVGNTADTVTQSFYNINFKQTFLNDPVFLADVQTADGMDTADVRWQNKNEGSVEIQIDEEQSRDSETDHTTEVVGYMAFASVDVNADADADSITDGDEVSRDSDPSEPDSGSSASGSTTVDEDAEAGNQKKSDNNNSIINAIIRSIFNSINKR